MQRYNTLATLRSLSAIRLLCDCFKYVGLPYKKEQSGYCKPVVRTKNTRRQPSAGRYSLGLVFKSREKYAEIIQPLCWLLELYGLIHANNYGTCVRTDLSTVWSHFIGYFNSQTWQFSVYGKQFNDLRSRRSFVMMCPCLTPSQPTDGFRCNANRDLPPSLSIVRS